MKSPMAMAAAAILACGAWLAADTTANTFQDLYMTSAQDGWALVANQNEDAVIRTANGGKTWTQASPIIGPSLRLSVFNSRTAAVLEDAPLRLRPGVSHLFVTHDGGRHWSDVPLSSRSAPLYPSFATINAQGTWVIGTKGFPDTMQPPGGELLRVTNNGTLQRIGSVPPGADWLWMGRGGTGLLWCGNRTDALFTTSNGGASWKRADIVGFPVQGESVQFPAPPQVFARNTQLYLPYYSFPTGTTGKLSVLRADGPLGPWKPIWSRRFASLTNTPRLFLSSAAQWYTYTPGAPQTLWRTVNSGKSWTREHANIPLTEVADIQFVTPKIGFGLLTKGLSSIPIETRDGGVTWTSAENTPTAASQGAAS